MDVSIHGVRANSAEKLGVGEVRGHEGKEGREVHQASWEEKLLSRAVLELRIESGLYDLARLSEQRR